MPCNIIWKVCPREGDQKCKCVERLYIFSKHEYIKKIKPEILPLILLLILYKFFILFYKAWGYCYMNRLTSNEFPLAGCCNYWNNKNDFCNLRCTLVHTIAWYYTSFQTKDSFRSVGKIWHSNNKKKHFNFAGVDCSISLKKN